MADRIHIIGAAGSGKSTLAAAIAARFGHAHLDTDDYLWEPTDPPYQRLRDRATRAALLAPDLDAHPRWVLSGSLCGWGDRFIPRLDLVIWLVAPTAVRLARLRERERQLWGDAALAPGGALHATHAAFLAWAATYDDADESAWSRRRHEAWLARLPCPTLRLDGQLTLADQPEILSALSGRGVAFGGG